MSTKLDLDPTRVVSDGAAQGAYVAAHGVSRVGQGVGKLWAWGCEWLGERYAKQCYLAWRWFWKILGVGLGAAGVMFLDIRLASAAIMWATWAFTSYSKLIPPRWPRWQIPATWTFLMFGTAISLVLAPQDMVAHEITIAAVIALGLHRAAKLRAMWRPAGLGAVLISGWGIAPWPWRAIILAGVLLFGASIAVFTHPIVGSFVAMAAAIASAWRWREDAKDADALDDLLTEMSMALCGVLTDRQGRPWDPTTRRAPIQIAEKNPAHPREIAVLAAELPSGWKATEADVLESEMKARLKTWGEWQVNADASARRVEIRKVQKMPEKIGWNGKADIHAIQIGVGRIPAKAAQWDTSVHPGDLAPVTWKPVYAPHLLIVGPTGAGKSVAVRAVILQCLAAKDPYGRPLADVVLMDPKQVEFSMFEGRPGVERVAYTPEDISDTAMLAEREMQERYALMRKHRVSHIDDLPPEHKFKRKFIVCDEFAQLVRVEGLDDKAEIAVRLRAKRAFASMAELGRAAGIHLVLLTQRPDTKTIPGQVRDNIGARLLCGPASRDAIEMVYGSENIPAITPGVKGRARWSATGEPPREVQGIWVSSEDIDTHAPLPDGPIATAPVSPAVDDQLARWWAGEGVEPVTVTDEEHTAVRTL